MKVVEHSCISDWTDYFQFTFKLCLVQHIKTWHSAYEGKAALRISGVKNNSNVRKWDRYLG